MYDAIYYRIITVYAYIYQYYIETQLLVLLTKRKYMHFLINGKNKVIANNVVIINDKTISSLVKSLANK